MHCDHPECIKKILDEVFRIIPFARNQKDFERMVVDRGMEVIMHSLDMGDSSSKAIHYGLITAVDIMSVMTTLLTSKDEVQRIIDSKLKEKNHEAS